MRLKSYTVNKANSNTQIAERIKATVLLMGMNIKRMEKTITTINVAVKYIPQSARSLGIFNPSIASRMKITAVPRNTDSSKAAPKRLMNNWPIQNSIIPVKNGIAYKMPLANWIFRTNITVNSKMRLRIDKGMTMYDGKNIPINSPITVNAHMTAKCFSTRFKLCAYMLKPHFLYVTSIYSMGFCIF